jgi:hypothetical protein
MSMMSGLSDLEGTALAKVLRRTIVSAIIVGAAPSSSPCCSRKPGPRWASPSGSAWPSSTSASSMPAWPSSTPRARPINKVLRRAMGTKSVTRLGVITVICIGLLLLNGALGIGA